MTEQWQHQLRIYLTEPWRSLRGAIARDPALAGLNGVLQRHDATPVSQFDAFESYVRQAEQEGTEKFPLYKWTKATLEDPAKRAKHIRAFALHVAGHEVYARDAADALEADLQPLLGCGVIERISRHDTNPANNLSVPPNFDREIKIVLTN